MAKTALKAPTIRPGRPTAVETSQLNERLLDVAAELFLELGYAGTTIEKIGKRARASNKTVYARYANKAEVLTAVIGRLTDRVLAGAAFDSDEPARPVQAAKHFAELAMRFVHIASDPMIVGINRLVISEAQRSPEVVTVFSQGPDRARSFIAAALDHHNRSGSFKLAHSPEVAASIFFDLATSAPRMRALLGQPMSERALVAHARHTVEIFMSGAGIARRKRFWSDDYDV